MPTAIAIKNVPACVKKQFYELRQTSPASAYRYLHFKGFISREQIPQGVEVTEIAAKDARPKNARTQNRVLDLLQNETKPLTSAEVAERLPNVPHGSIEVVLPKLHKDGFLDRKKEGKWFYYWATGLGKHKTKRQQIREGFPASWVTVRELMTLHQATEETVYATLRDLTHKGLIQKRDCKNGDRAYYREYRLIRDEG